MRWVRSLRTTKTKIKFLVRNGLLLLTLFLTAQVDVNPINIVGISTSLNDVLTKLFILAVPVILLMAIIKIIFKSLKV